MSAEASAQVESAAIVERPAARRACIVVLGGRPFAVDVVDTREVVVLDATTPVPGAPSSVVGVMNLRGTVLPVIEAKHCGTSDDHGKQQQSRIYPALIAS